jgi:tetratricopeptide (TPR) repeat protein
MNEETLFHEALARSTPQERAAFLARACAGQPELRAAVEALLAAHEQPGDFLCPRAVMALPGADEPAPDSAAGAGAPSLRRVHETVNAAGSTNASRPPEPGAGRGDLPGASPGQGGAVPPAADVPGRVGRYEIRRLLGRGGMGAVYLAHDPELDRPVALKVPKLAGPDAEERFLREARAAAAVSHPNLCPVYDAGRTDGVLYLAMAYVPGPTLTEVLRQDGPLPPARCAAIAAGVARGMAEAHRHGIVHRDLKPGNILLNRRGEPVVTDFGLVLRAGVRDGTAEPAATVDHDPRLTQSGVLMGTPAYMPPEQARGELDRIGPASDVYALGAILFELLTGRPPFPTTPLLEMVRQIENQPAPPPSAVRRGVPPGLDAVCQRAMAKDPASRLASMDLFAEALAPFAAGPRRRWARVAVATAALVLLAVAAVVFYVATDNGTVEVRLSDPAADVQVSVDGNEIRLTEGGRVTKLRSGPHGLEVKGQGFETVTRLFKVTRGEKTVVEVKLIPPAKSEQPTKAGPPPLPPDRARLAGLLVRGRQLIRQGRFGDVGPVADEALKIDPESPGALALRATFRASQHDVVSARADAEAALKLNPETYRALFIRAYLNAEDGKYDESIADLTAALRLDPTDPAAWANRATSYFRKGEYRQAIADAARAIDLGTTQEHPYLNRGAASACLGDYPKALADYDAAYKIGPSKLQVLIQRSAVHAKAGNAEKAAADWAEARKLDPTLTDDRRAVIPDLPKPPERKKLTAEEADALAAALGAGEKAVQEGRNAAARQAIEEALRLDLTSANAHALRARLLATLGQSEQALRAANEAIRLDPSHAWAYTARGNARNSLKDRAGAIADHTIALRLDPEHSSAWNNRGYAYSLRHQYHQAIADLNEALRLRPNYPIAVTNRAVSYLGLGENEKALADYARAADLQPTNGRWLLLCAAVRARLGDGEGSARDRDRAIKIDPQLANAPGATLPSPIPKPKQDPELPPDNPEPPDP